MLPRVLELREHETTPAVELSAADRVAIERAPAQLVLRSRGNNRYDVEAADVVGAFSTPSLRVVIHPKIRIRRLLYLIAFAQQLPVLTNRVVLDESADLLTTMQQMFASALERALRGGLIRTYVEQQDQLRSPRGRIDAIALVRRRFSVFPPLDCVFREFSADVEANQRLLAAAHLLLRFDSNSNAAAGLRKALGYFEEVSARRFDPMRISPLQLDRRWDRFSTALSLADVVLRHGTVELKGGRTTALGFLVSMNRLYEDVVAIGLREALKERPERWVRHVKGTYLDEEKTTRLEPDVVWYRANRVPAVVLDAKYKVTDAARREDQFQISAYCQAMRASRAALVYARIEERRTKLVNGPSLALFQLDPDAEPDVLRERFSMLATKLRDFVTGTS